MKKSWKRILLISVVMTMLCGCQPGSDAQEKENDPKEPLYTYTDERFLSMEDFIDYVPKVALNGVKEDERYFQLSSVGHFTVMQGGCTDGKYMYFALENNRLDPHTDLIFKVDMDTWEVVAQSEELGLNHANGLTYNSKLHSLIVVHGAGAQQDISFVNPDTFQITDRKTLNYKMYGLAYNEEKGLYAVGISGTPDFAVLDSDFNEIGYYKGHSVGLGNQSIEVDENYIYFGNTGRGENLGVEMVKVYNWDGGYEGIFRWDTVSEQEALIRHGNDLFVTFFTGNGGRVFRADLDSEIFEKK